MKRFVLAGITTYVAAYTAGWVIFRQSPLSSARNDLVTYCLMADGHLHCFPDSSRLALCPFHKEGIRLSNQGQTNAHHFAISICFPSWSSKLSAPPARKWADDGSGDSQRGHMADNSCPVNPKSSSRSAYLWAGAYGGTLTPSFALGMAGAALISLVLGVGNTPAFFLLGSVCFLTVTLKAPLSATGLVLGFTGQGLTAPTLSPTNCHCHLADPGV